MFSQLIYCIFSFFILFNSISTDVDDILCLFNQTKCLIYNESWCCDDHQFCGRYSNNCIDFITSTQSNSSLSEFPSGLLIVLILVPFFLLSICICTGLQSRQDQQSQHSQATNSTHQIVTNSFHRSTSLVLIRRNYNIDISSTMNSIYEEPPPSYDIAMADLPPKYTSTPIIAMIEE